MKYWGTPVVLKCFDVFVLEVTEGMMDHFGALTMPF